MNAQSTLIYPPGPRGVRTLRALGRSTSERLDALRDIGRDHPQIAHINVLGTHLYFLNDPALVRKVLVEQADRFYNMPLAFRNTGIPTPKKAAAIQHYHRDMRRLLAPAFTPSAVAPYAETIIRFTREWLDSWPIGETRDILPEMTRLTLRIVAKVLFDLDLTERAGVINEAVTRGMVYLTNRWRPIRTPVWIPKSSNIALAKSWIIFDGAIRRIVVEKKRNPTGGVDVLSRLFAVTEAQGSPLTVKQAHTEIMSLLIAGHETTATVMSWALYGLTDQHAVMTHMQTEADSVAQNNERNSLNADSQLPYIHAVASELIRLYPPAYVLQRYCVQPTELGNYIIPRGGSVFMSAYTMHRDPRYFADPETFNPERWLNGLDKQLPPFAYFPFGGGAHICTGQFLAWLELQLILATVAQTARFERAPGDLVGFAPTITLRPDRPILLTRRK